VLVVGDDDVFCEFLRGRGLGARRGAAAHRWLNWTHARPLIRVWRVTEQLATEKKTVGNRYYVSSEAPAARTSQAPP
jgi:hypothetical protein